MRMVLALDPGLDKVGVALLRLDGEVVRRAVLSVLSLRSDLLSFVSHDRDALEALVVGNGTGSAEIRAKAESILGGDLDAVEIDERKSTLEARGLFYQDHPPPLLLRILPRGLWPEPDVPLDGYAAEVLGRRWLGGDGREAVRRAKRAAERAAEAGSDAPQRDQPAAP